jgi:hypothetical protein
LSRNADCFELERLSPDGAFDMNRVEYVWSLLVALIILGGTVVWTAASTPLTPPVAAASPTPSAATAKLRASCWHYSQHEFKVGLVVDRGCQSQAN